LSESGPGGAVASREIGGVTVSSHHWCILTPRRCAVGERKQDDRTEDEVSEEGGLRLRAEQSDESEEHGEEDEDEESEEDEPVLP
jgi:hypothetical protein